MIYPLKTWKPCHYYFMEKTTYAPHHLGQDLSVNYEPLFAPINGTVLRTGRGTQAGNYIHFAGDDGKFIRFFHLSRIDVRANQNMKEGQMLGVTGNSGLSYAPHLHVDVWTEDPLTAYPKAERGDYSKLIDPLKYFIPNENHMNCAQKDIRFNFDPTDGSVWICNKGKRYKIGTAADDIAVLAAKFAGETISAEEKNYPVTINRKEVL